MTQDVTTPEYAQEVYKRVNCLPFHFTELTPELRRKAKDELGEESEDMVRESLETLRKLMAESGEDWIPDPDDKVMIRFLRARKYDMKRALLLVKSYYRFQKKYWDILKTTGPEVLQKGMDEKLQVILPYRNPSGCHIWICCIGRWNPDTFTFHQMMQMSIGGIQMALKYPITQICGMVLLWDLKRVNWKHILQLTPSNLSCYFSGLQDSCPTRLKEIHVVHGIKLFQIAFYIIKPFMSAKMRNRIFIHGNDMSSLHKHIPPEILPAEYGGHLGPYQDYGLYDTTIKSQKSLLKIMDYGYKGGRREL